MENQSFLHRFFKLTEKKTTLKTEIIAGITTFFTMVYIVFVNPSIFWATQAWINKSYLSRPV